MRLVVADALRRAIPSLDIVLTPNGFGVVNTSNLAPASKPRVDRLVGSMLAHRDDCISALLPALVGASKWLTSSQAVFFGATLFPTLDIVDAVGGATGSKREKYFEVRPQIIDLEASLAEDWFSLELMAHLRSANLSHTLSSPEQAIVTDIRAALIYYLRNVSFVSRRLADTAYAAIPNSFHYGISRKPRSVCPAHLQKHEEKQRLLVLGHLLSVNFLHFFIVILADM